jgi:quercetin dioxygenase-like cupin family protein
MGYHSSVLYAGISCRRYDLRVGEHIEPHGHAYDHVSILAVGQVRFGEQVLTAPACLHVPQGTMHGVEALESSVWFCLASHAHVEMMEQEERERCQHRSLI